MFIEAAPREAKPRLREVSAIQRGVAPDVTEALKCGHPFLEDERILFAHFADRSHLDFMPTGPSLEPFREELAGI